MCTAALSAASTFRCGRRAAGREARGTGTQHLHTGSKRVHIQTLPPGGRAACSVWCAVTKVTLSHPALYATHLAL
eukprot:364266-Chlamydomonas_euryale.AAC.5